MCLFLILSISGCGITPGRDPIVISPPENLLNNTSQPEYSGVVYGDLIDYIETQRAALNQCNADKESIKKYIEENKKAR